MLLPMHAANVSHFEYVRLYQSYNRHHSSYVEYILHYENHLFSLLCIDIEIPFHV